MPYEPPAIRALWNTFKQAVPQAQLGGIGGSDWKPGYHSSANGNKRKWPGNYSIQRADDLRGDGEAARAIDITLPNPADMKRYTQRLIDATLRGDSRMLPCREFFGTVNGRTVTGLDVRDKRWVTSDPSHLWHIHISFYTRYATDHALMQGVAGVLLGTSGDVKPPTTDKDMIHMDISREELDALINGRITEAMQALAHGSDKGTFTQKANPRWVRKPGNGIWNVADRQVETNNNQRERLDNQNRRITALEKKVK